MVRRRDDAAQARSARASHARGGSAGLTRVVSAAQEVDEGDEEADEVDEEEGESEGEGEEELESGEGEDGDGESEEEELEGEELEDEEDENESDSDESVLSGESGGAEAEGAEAETESDTDDEAPINTIGNVPLHWYDGYGHVGYDLDGQKILRGARVDELDALIKRFDDPNAARTIHDALHGVDVVLKDEDIALIRRLQKRQYPHAEVDAYQPMPSVPFEDGIHPLSNAPPRKGAFIPSKSEAKQVMKLVMAMRSEQYQKSVANRAREDAKLRPDYQYLIWDDAAEPSKHHKRLPPPRVPLPGNAESYNPPEEYLFTEAEAAAWAKMDPADRPLNFEPRKYPSLRRVPLYDPLIKERFERCLDLYLCPRAPSNKLDVAPESLIPQLPSPSELRPFPERLSVRFVGHEARVHSISVDPKGCWLLSASADGTVRLWEVSSSRCERVWRLGAECRCVAWNPLAQTPVAAVAAGQKMLLLAPLAPHGDAAAAAEALLAEGGADGGAGSGASGEGEGGSGVAWTRPEPSLRAAGVAWEVSHVKSASSVCWHHKGDYLASVAPEGASRAVLLHQLSRRHSGSPFAKSKGRVEGVAFHPSKPILFVATQRHVRVYNLLKQELAKKLNPAAQWISSIAVHPSGDHVLVGAYDKRVCWFDLDLSTSPYRTLRSHKLAVRSVAFHPRLPLFASAADDGTLHIYHGRVYADLLTNALIVPLKILRGHKITDHLGVMGIAFHPTQPWIFSAGADGEIHLSTG